MLFRSGMERCPRGSLGGALAAAGAPPAAPSAARSSRAQAATSVPQVAPGSPPFSQYKLLPDAVFALDESADRELTRLEQEFVDKRTEQERARAAAALASKAEQAARRWSDLAKRKEWESVKADLSVYAQSGEDVKSDPRRTEAYRDKVVNSLGFSQDWRVRHPDLTEEDVQACREVLRRKAAAFWMEGELRTTVR